MDGIRFPDAVGLQVDYACVFLFQDQLFDSIDDRFHTQHLGVRVISSIT